MAFIEYIAPSKAAKQLGIAPATLRKYANMIEKQDSDKEYFMRDENNRRLYSKEDITLIERILSLKVSEGITLENAIDKALGKGDTSIKTGGDTEDGSATQSDMSVLYDVIKQQQEQLDQYKDLAEHLAKSNIQLSADLEKAIGSLNETNTKLLEYKEEQEQIEPEKKGNFLSRLFKK